jgi:acyl-CoA thioester hydrolase
MKIAIPEHKKLVYEMSMPVRWGDMDSLGHVNNAVYFRYMEAIRVDWFQTLGFSPRPTGHGPVIVNTFCNFHKQIEYPNELLLKLYVSDPARTTFEMWCTMALQGHPSVIYASGGATTIWVDFAVQKAIELPLAVRELVTP